MTIVKLKIILLRSTELMCKDWNCYWKSSISMILMKTYDDKEEMSREHMKFMDIMENTVNIKEGCYSLKLPSEQGSYHANVCIAQQCLEDKNYVCFLWWPNGDFMQDVSEFRMTVHLLYLGLFYY